MAHPMIVLACLMILLPLFASTAPVSASESRPANPLPACPDRPNCVRSDDAKGRHAIAPIAYTGTRASMMARVAAFLTTDANTALTSQTEDALHLEIASSLFAFVDDMALFFPPEVPVIHVRSASRTGYYDFGVNRRRIERLRQFVTELCNKP